MQTDTTRPLVNPADIAPTYAEVAAAHEALQRLLQFTPPEGATAFPTKVLTGIMVTAQAVQRKAERFDALRRQLSAHHALLDGKEARRHTITSRQITRTGGGGEQVQEQDAPADFIHKDEEAFYKAQLELAEDTVELRVRQVPLECLLDAGVPAWLVSPLVGVLVAAPEEE